MKKIIKEFNIYSIQELQGEGLEKAMEDIKEKVIEDNFFFLEEYLYGVLEEDYGIDAFEVGYSLTYSQGDGLHFNTKDFFTRSVYESMLARLSDSDEDKKKLQVLVILMKHKEYVNVYIDHTWRYAFASFRDVNVSVDESLEELFNKIGIKLHQVITFFEEAIVKEYVDIAKHLERIGYNCYEVDDNTILQYAYANELTFLESGEAYYE